jgi:hypothetical protein
MVFARYVRETDMARNADGGAHTQRALSATVPYTALEDAEAFHELAEQIRLGMLDKLREDGAPVNTWRLGQVGGFVACTFDYARDEEKPWKDEHVVYLRVRTSIERSPLT